jgi:hypothetical protein
MAVSKPTKSHYTGDVKDIVFHTNARLMALNIDVRTVRDNVLWSDGRYPQSQLGKCMLANNGGVVFLDIVGPNLSPLEFLDTLFHEGIHATGIHFGRWTTENQPSPEYLTHKFNLEYLIEEAIAIKGALELAVAFNLRRPQDIEPLFFATIDAVKIQGQSTCS